MSATMCIYVFLHGTTEEIGSAVLYSYYQHHDYFTEHCMSGNMIFIVLIRGEEPAILHTIIADQTLLDVNALSF